MKNNLKGFTIIEILIGVSLLAVITGGILGTFIVIQRYYKNGLAMADSEASARAAIEGIIRPEIREANSFMVGPGGDYVSVTRFDSTVNTFIFSNGDGNDATTGDNTLQKNGEVITYNVTKVPGEEVFEEIEANERLGINFGIRNEGANGIFKEVRIITEIKLRN